MCNMYILPFIANLAVCKAGEVISYVYLRVWWHLTPYRGDYEKMAALSRAAIMHFVIKA